MSTMTAEQKAKYEIIKTLDANGIDAHFAYFGGVLQCIATETKEVLFECTNYKQLDDAFDKRSQAAKVNGIWICLF